MCNKHFKCLILLKGTAVFNLYAVIFSAVTVTFISVLYSYHSYFFHEPSLEIVFIAVLDMFLSCLVFYLVVIIKNGQNRFSDILESFKLNYLNFSYQARYLIYSLLFYALYLAYQSINLIMMGSVRQELISEYGTMGIGYICVSSFFKILFPFSLLFKTGLPIRLSIIIGFFSTMLITGSRSELTYAAYLLLTIAAFSPDKKIFFKLFITIIVFLFFGLFITIFAQDRPVADGVMGLFSVVEKHFYYRAYSIHLAEISILASDSFEKFIYPLFGYPSEWLLSKFWELENVIGSDFISRYFYLGFDEDYNKYFTANVVYPWWSWFYGTYGLLGLIIKAVYCYLILFLARSFKLPITFVYISCYILFIGQAGSFLMTLNSVIVLSFAILIDLIGKYNLKVRK